MADTVLVLAGGDRPSPSVIKTLNALPPAAMCIAADSGIDHARAFGRVPDLAVGDFDSVTPDGLAWATDNGTRLDRHPTAKDATDLEIALDAAAAARPERIVVAAIGGGRFDHLLANVAAITDARYARAAPDTDIDAFVDTALLSVIHAGRPRTLSGDPDELVSLLPVNGDAEGVTTAGLGYPLGGEPLPAATSRGISNYFVEPQATVSLTAGTLLAVQPERLTR